MRITSALSYFVALGIAATPAHAQEPETSEDQRFTSMVRNVCQRLSIAARDDVSTIARDIEDAMLAHNGWDRSTENYRLKFSQFFNENSTKFICSNDSHLFNEQHLFQRTIILKAYTPVLINFLLADENEYPIDVNVITTNFKGEQETVLDFVDAILRSSNADLNFNVDEIRELREVLIIHYNAKHASQIE